LSFNQQTIYRLLISFFLDLEIKKQVEKKGVFTLFFLYGCFNIEVTPFYVSYVGTLYNTQNDFL